MGVGDGLLHAPCPEPPCQSSPGTPAGGLTLVSRQVTRLLCTVRCRGFLSECDKVSKHTLSHLFLGCTADMPLSLSAQIMSPSMKVDQPPAFHPESAFFKSRRSQEACPASNHLANMNAFACIMMLLTFYIHRRHFVTCEAY